MTNRYKSRVKQHLGAMRHKSVNPSQGRHDRTAIGFRMRSDHERLMTTSAVLLPQQEDGLLRHTLFARLFSRP